MKAPAALAAILISLTPLAVLAQDDAPGLGEVLVTATRGNAPYALDGRPVVGLRRRADSAVVPLTISSDTREAATRYEEIYTALLGAIDKAAGSGVEIVRGAFRLEPVTRANYKDLVLMSGNRVDTSTVTVLVKVPLQGSAAATQARLQAFIGSLKGSGRATVEGGGGITLTVVDPDQYRDAIVRLVAADAKHNASIFGAEFTFNATGIDGQVAWSQVSPTDVFLYIPYRYNIVPKQ